MTVFNGKCNINTSSNIYFLVYHSYLKRQRECELYELMKIQQLHRGRQLSYYQGQNSAYKLLMVRSLVTGGKTREDQLSTLRKAACQDQTSGRILHNRGRHKVPPTGAALSIGAPRDAMSSVHRRLPCLKLIQNFLSAQCDKCRAFS